MEHEAVFFVVIGSLIVWPLNSRLVEIKCYAKYYHLDFMVFLAAKVQVVGGVRTNNKVAYLSLENYAWLYFIKQ